MPISVRAPDGTIYRVNTDDEQVARRTVRNQLARQQQEQEARTRSGDPRVPGSVGGAIAGQAAVRSTPTQAQRQQLAASAANRQFQRNAIPFGLGNITAPLANMVRDPDRRAGVARATQGLARDIQQVPNLDAGRLASETSASVSQGFRDLPQTAGNIARNLPQIGRAITYGPFADEERAQQQLELARMRGLPNATAQAADQANMQTANIGVNVGGPLVGVGSVPRAAAAGAGLSAPFALARDSERPLQERLPAATTETLGAASFAAGAQGLANGLPSLVRRPSRGNQRAADFEAAGVRPTLAAVNGGTSAAVTKMIGENFFAGPMVRRRLEQSIEDTAAAARRLATEAGEIQPREIVGESIQERVRDFARNRDMPNPRPGTPAMDVPTAEWTLPAKSDAVYGDVFGRLSRDEAAYAAGSVNGLVGITDTLRTLEQIETRVSGSASREAMRSPVIRRMMDALNEDLASGTLRFQDLRAWRTWVREAQMNEGLRQGVANADLQRIEQALTADIYRSADQISPGAADDLRAADRWYRRETQMIQNVLDQFRDKPNVGGAQAYRRMIDLAMQGGRQNTRRLTQALSVMPETTRRSIAATLIDELGNPSFGSSNVLEPNAFSVDLFLSNYARLAPDGRRAMFGDLTEQLDTLARVAGYQKGVEAMTNRSRSGVNAQNFGTGLGILNPSTTVPTLALLGAGVLTGELLTKPSFVRWLTSAPRNGDRAGMRRHLTELSRLAARDPALGPVLAAYQAELEGGQSRRGPASNGDPAGMPQQREPAIR